MTEAPRNGSGINGRVRFDWTINIPSLAMILGWAIAGAMYVGQQANRVDTIERDLGFHSSFLQRLADQQVARGERVSRLEAGQDAILRALANIDQKLQHDRRKGSIE